MLSPSAHQQVMLWYRSPTVWCLGMAGKCDCSSSKSPASWIDGLTVLILCWHLSACTLLEALCCVSEFGNMLSSMTSATFLCLSPCNTIRIALGPSPCNTIRLALGPSQGCVDAVSNMVGSQLLWCMNFGCSKKPYSPWCIRGVLTNPSTGCRYDAVLGTNASTK